MNNQQIFDIVSVHLLTQNEKAIKGKYDCFYRTDNGLKCAVGCLIPDHIYDPSMETHSVEFLLDSFPIIKKEKIFDIKNLKLLEDLQSIHDDYEVEEWKIELKKTANKFRLNSNILNKF